MLPREDGAHGIGRIDDIDECCFFVGQSGQMLQVDLKVPLLNQLVSNCHSFHGGTHILVERVAELGH